MINHLNKNTLSERLIYPYIAAVDELISNPRLGFLKKLMRYAQTLGHLVQEKNDKSNK